ncbi:hypothetical protein IT575_01675 [bacterium]|nr:hypothetical protein [bacterium]
MAERQAITMETVLGTKVLIHLHREAYELLSIQGIESERFVAMVLGLDSFGLWIENPSYCTIPVYDDLGGYIPPEARVEVCHRAVVLIQWGYIQTILQFPDRMNYRPGVDETEIGFRRHLVEMGKASTAGHIETPGDAGRIKVPVTGPAMPGSAGKPRSGGKGTTEAKAGSGASSKNGKASKEKKRG